MTSDEKNLLIPKIENGHVIDHVPVGLGTKILQLVEKFPELDQTLVTLGRNLNSKRLGRKDIVKISANELPPRFLRHLSLIAMGVTIKQVSRFKVERKIVIDPPELIHDLLTCPNPNCITNEERLLQTCFHCVERKPIKYSCNFCERHFLLEELQPNTIHPRG